MGSIKSSEFNKWRIVGLDTRLLSLQDYLTLIKHNLVMCVLSTFQDSMLQEPN